MTDVLITDATGKVGNAVARLLLARGRTVHYGSLQPNRKRGRRERDNEPDQEG